MSPVCGCADGGIATGNLRASIDADVGAGIQADLPPMGRRPASTVADDITARGNTANPPELDEEPKEMGTPAAEVAVGENPSRPQQGRSHGDRILPLPGDFQ
jgi:hypothetical protein